MALVGLQDAFPKNAKLCLDDHVTRESDFVAAAGGSADVYEGMFGSQKVAIKVVRRFTSNGVEMRQEKLLRRLWREYMAWSRLSHPNIVPCLGYSYGFSSGYDALPSLISPWMENGSVSSYLEKYPDADRVELLVGAAKGLSYLHTREPVLIHGDVRAGNILVSDKGVPCVSDFGLSRALEEEIKGMATSSELGGTVRWMSPELFDGDAAITVYSDVWAFGMTILEVLSGERPYYSTARTNAMVLGEIRGGRLPLRPRRDNVSEVFDDRMWETCRRCWAREPAARPSMEDVASMLCLSGPLSTAFPQDPFAQNTELCLNGHIIRKNTFPTESGNYADLYEGFFGKQKVAIKVIRQLSSQGTKMKQEKILRQLWPVYLVWSRLTHPNILECLGYSYDFSPGPFRLPSLISPWMENGTVASYLERYPDADRIKLLIGIARGLSYLHSQEPIIVHGDVRAGNILVSDQGVPFLTDFRLSRVLQGVKGMITSRELAGFVRWTSPELFGKDAEVSVHSDTWSYGMTVLEILSRERPYATITNDLDVLGNIIKGKMPSRPQDAKVLEVLDDRVWETCQCCWALDPKARPSMDEVTSRLLLCCSPGIAITQDVFSRNTENCLDGCILRESIPMESGTCADVFRGVYGSRKVAIKVIRPFKLPREKILGRVCHEYLVWSRLAHPNILECLGYSYDFFPGSIPLPSLISPWMENGTVASYLETCPDADRIKLLIGVARGLCYLHSQEPVIVHGDVRAGNILVSDQGIPCLADFRLSRILEEVEGMNPSNELTGFVRWMSPELFDNGAKISLKSDTWAYGMTVLEVLSGERPFSAVTNDLTVLGQIRDGQIPARPRGRKVLEVLDDWVWGVCKFCWPREPALRPSMEEVTSMLLRR